MYSYGDNRRSGRVITLLVPYGSLNQHNADWTIGVTFRRVSAFYVEGQLRNSDIMLMRMALAWFGAVARIQIRPERD